MNRRTSTISLLLALTIILFLLPGCFSARIHMKVKVNGSAEMEVTMSASRALMSLKKTSEMFGKIKTDLVDDGFSIEDFAVDAQVGFTARKRVSRLDDFSTLSLGDDLMISEEPIVTLSRHALSNTYSVKADLDLDKILGDDMNVIAPLADIRFALTLPVKPAEHNADTVSENGRTLEWQLKAGTANPINVTATAPNIITLLLIVLLVAAGAAALIFTLIRRRGKAGGGKA